MLTHESAIAHIRTAIEAGRPYMFARYGDGEGIILGYPEVTPHLKYRTRLDKWFGSAGMTIDQLTGFAKYMRESVRACDLVGIPEKRHMLLDGNWRSVKQYMDRYRLLDYGQSVCGMDAVLWLQRRRHVPWLIRGVERLCCITCRDVCSKLRRACHDLKEIEFFYLPPQNKPRLGPDMANGARHYPDLYEKIPAWLDATCRPGQVYFIGAGGAGKIYSMWIKWRGGIAIDMGSLFDGWAGLMTRSHIRNEPMTWRL